ncbi:hypothetical protein DRN67_01320 [Candidatus Micrarchaeota archaeon]|nr:MAG: hypothetical protein DRN67_01320 [Candidatus Micrarchaeota archaeon]
MAKVVKSDGKLALGLPEQIVQRLKLKENDELALSELRPGGYIISKKGEQILSEVREEKGELGEKELGVVRKLESVKFSERTPRRISELLSSAEKRVLDGLVENGIIKLFRSVKYREGVYNIPKRIYELARAVKGEKREKMEKAEEKKQERKPAAVDSDDPEQILEQRGYLIVERERDVKAISDRLYRKVKNGEIMGVRGFDKRFYLARKGFYSALSERIERAMKGKKAQSVREIAEQAKVKEDECAVVLNLMREEGEVLEKKKGVYQLA